MKTNVYIVFFVALYLAYQYYLELKTYILYLYILFSKCRSISIAHVEPNLAGYHVKLRRFMLIFVRSRMWGNIYRGNYSKGLLVCWSNTQQFPVIMFQHKGTFNNHCSCI